MAHGPVAALLEAAIGLAAPLARAAAFVGILFLVEGLFALASHVTLAPLLALVRGHRATRLLDHFAGIVPSVARMLVIVAVTLAALVVFPVAPEVRTAIDRSRVGSALVAEVAQLQPRLERLLGGTGFGSDLLLVTRISAPEELQRLQFPDDLRTALRARLARDRHALRPACARGDPLPPRRREPRLRAVRRGGAPGPHGESRPPREHPPSRVHPPRGRRHQRGPLRPHVRAALFDALILPCDDRPIDQPLAEAAEPIAAADAFVVAPPRERFAALAVPQFRTYWLASAVSITGDGMENVIRNWLVWELTRSPLWLGMMVFAHWIPFTVFSLYGGVLADRYDNRKVQLVVQALLLAAALGVAFVTLGGIVTEWWIFGLLLVHGFAGAIGSPAQQTLIHDLVGRERLLSAVSLNSSMRHVTQVLGPIVAGWFLIVLGAGWGFLVNAFTFVPLLVVLTRIRPRHRARIERLALGTRESLREGLRFLRGKPDLAALIAVEMVPVVFLGHALSSLMPAFATEVFHVGEAGYVGLLAASGLGAILAGVWLSTAHVRGRGRLIIAGAAAEAICILLFSLTTSYAVAFLLLVVAGVGSVITQSLTNAVLQLSAPDRLRGRVMGAYSFGTQGVRVANGPILGGAAQALASLPLAVSGAAIAVAGLLAAIAAAVPGLRRLD